MEFSNGVKKSSELLMVLLVVYTFITSWEPIDFFFINGYLEIYIIEFEV